MTLPVNTVPPAITISKDHRTLKGAPGTWKGTSISYAYAWLRCNTAVTSCTQVSRATTSSYRLSTADAGSRLRLQVTGSNTGGKTMALSQPSAVASSSGRL